MHYRFFANSLKSWQAMFDGILSAKKTIYLEMYIFQENLVEFDFLGLLKDKAREGVKIKIILDSFGSHDLSKKAIDEIKEAGIELLFLSYFLHRTHRKILVIDDTSAFIGGVNFHRNSSLWNDLVVQVRGKLVRSITRSFIKTYIESGGKDPFIISHVFRKIRTRRKVRAWLIEHSPVKNKFKLKDIYTKHISEAKEEIVLVTPYFMPKRWLVGLIHQAHLRGVVVSILIPEVSNNYIADRINYFYMSKLSRFGVNFYLEPQMNHAKIMTIDSREVVVGSNNLDYLSFELNSEIGIFFKDKEAIQKISRIIEKWKKDSVLFDVSKYKMKWFDYILFPVINIFARVF